MGISVISHSRTSTSPRECTGTKMSKIANILKNFRGMCRRPPSLALLYNPEGFCSVFNGRPHWNTWQVRWYDRSENGNILARLCLSQSRSPARNHAHASTPGPPAMIEPPCQRPCHFSPVSSPHSNLLSIVGIPTWRVFCKQRISWSLIFSDKSLTIFTLGFNGTLVLKVGESFGTLERLLMYLPFFLWVHIHSSFGTYQRETLSWQIMAQEAR